MPTLGGREERAALAALRSGMLSEGPRVAEFERAVAADLGRRGGVAVNSGTAALTLALMTLEGRGRDEVIVPSYVCTAVLDACHAAGAAPRVVDVDPSDLNIDPQAAAEAVTQGTRAILAAHMHGAPADVASLAGLGPPVIEDLAQCVGAERDGLRVGAGGACAVLSFYATKLLTTGYGGMLVSSDRGQLDRARDLRSFDNRRDWKPRLHVSLSEINAAVGLSQWRGLPRMIARRRALARRYDAVAGDRAVRPNGRGVYYRYLVRARQGAPKAIRAFREVGVEAKRPVFRPIHRYLGLDRKRFPVTEKAHREIVSVPLYPALRESQVRRILRALTEVIAP